MEPNESRIEDVNENTVKMDVKNLYLVFMSILICLLASALVGLVVLVWKAFEYGLLSLN